MGTLFTTTTLALHPFPRLQSTDSVSRTSSTCLRFFPILINLTPEPRSAEPDRTSTRALSRFLRVTGPDPSHSPTIQSTTVTTSKVDISRNTSQTSHRTSNPNSLSGLKNRKSFNLALAAKESFSRLRKKRNTSNSGISSEDVFGENWQRTGTPSNVPSIPDIIIPTPYVHTQIFARARLIFARFLKVSEDPLPPDLQCPQSFVQNPHSVCLVILRLAPVASRQKSQHLLCLPSRCRLTHYLHHTRQ